MKTLAIVGGTVYRDARRRPTRATVVLRRGKVAAVGSGLRPPPGAEVIDAQGLVVTPGLIDVHTHLGNFGEGTGPAGFDGNEAAAAATPQVRALDGIDPQDLGFADARRGGITCACVLPGSANVIGGTAVVLKTAGEIVDQMVVRADAGMKVAFGENPKFSHDGKRMPKTRMGTAAVLREMLVKAREYRRKRRLAPARRPDLDLGMEALGDVLARRMPLRAHAHRADDIATSVRIAREFKCRIVADHCTEGYLIAEFLRAARVPCVVGPTVVSRFKVELRKRSYGAAGVLEKAGCAVALTTDHPFMPIDTLATGAALAVREGMTPAAAFHAVTHGAAEVLGLGKRLGRLAPGYDGDVVVWTDHPFASAAKVAITIISGEVVFRR